MFTFRDSDAADQPGTPLIPVAISVLTVYAGLSLAVAGFVLDYAAMVVAGMILVCCSSIVVNLKAKASMRTREVKGENHFINRGGV